MVMKWRYLVKVVCVFKIKYKNFTPVKYSFQTKATHELHDIKMYLEAIYIPSISVKIKNVPILAPGWILRLKRIGKSMCRSRYLWNNFNDWILFMADAFVKISTLKWILVCNGQKLNCFILFGVLIE